MNQRLKTNAIQLPPPPLCVAAPEDEGRTEEPVIVTHVNGEKTQGTLISFSLDEAIMSIYADSSTQIVQLADMKILQLTRSRKLIKLQESVTTRGRGVISPTDKQEFEILFKDKSKLTGETFGFRVHRMGLHLFCSQKGGDYLQLFAPFSAIQDYRIGPHLGQALVHDKLISDKDIKSGLEEQAKIRNQPLGEYLKSMVIVTPKELEAALTAQKAVPNLKLGEVLINENLINKDQLDAALVQQDKNRKTPLGEILVSMGLITHEAIKKTLARKLGIPFVDLRQFDVDSDAMKLVPDEMARKYMVMPLYLFHSRLIFAIENPMNWEAIDAVRFRTKVATEAVMATHSDIDWAIERYYGALRADAGIDAWGLDVETLEVDEDENNETSTAQAQRESQEKPIVRFVNGLLLEGMRSRASDVHIRPGAKTVDIMFRCDGELKIVRPLSRNLLAPVVSRIKIMGHMNIADRRRPQDGRIRMKFAGRIVDYRVSVMPTIHGESVVIRVQDKSAGLKDFASLGFAGRDEAELNDMLSRNAGIILVTGATGSGKSSTLYAGLQKLVERNLHVITVEDPVEAEVAGAEQIQVNNAADYTFASALRNILRHDPDAIMVGEIRDHETAQIALESAMTGHLVLSTLHTNDAPSAINRLIEMGTEPFVLGIALLGVLSQRLVRLNCPHCLHPETVSKDVLERLGVDSKTVFYHGTGCQECNNTGCIGRTAVYELLRVTPEIRELINAKRSAADIRRVANQQGMVDLAKQALALAKSGKISLKQAYLVNQG